jgi:four helix bundle protein
MRGVWRFEDLVAWQLAVQLEQLVDRYSERPAIKRVFKFREQLIDAAASGPRNIAEGFGRYHHPEFSRFARIVRASEEEVLNHFLRAQRKGYISIAECDDGTHAARKALKAVNGLIRHLDSTPDFGKN